MGANEDSRRRTFEVCGDVALAWYFVMAHWPDQRTTPELEFGPGPMRLIFDPSPEVLYTLRRTLEQAAGWPGTLGDSASVLLDSIGSKLPTALPPSSPFESDAG